MSAALRQWLETLGLAQYGDRFAADDIDLDVLPSLSEQDLEKLGVSMGHRKRLLKAIAELTGAPAPAAHSGTRTVTPAQAPDTAEARKVVTIVFADLIGSTSLHEQLDTESVTRLMERYYRALRGAIEAHGGTVVKLLGDGVMAAFGVPRVAEDDAIRAVRAGVAMQQAFRELARRELSAVGDIGLRVGINTGEVVVAADDTDVVGDPVNVAARLQAEAHDGDVVIGESTRRLVAVRVTLAPLGRFALKGRTEAMNAYRVASLDCPVGTTAAAFVGRDDELARLTAVYEAARAAPAARLAVLLGSPGLGKSRLIGEVARRLGDAASVVTAHCDAAGGATFAPVAAALREHFEIEAGATPSAVRATIEAAIPATDAERGRIAAGVAALLGDSPASPEETFFVLRRLLAGLAAAKPVVLAIDDLHWAEPLLLDLVEHLVQWGSGTPLLLLVGARPELRDLRASLVTPGGLVADVVTLGGLDAGAAMRLAASVIGAADLPAAVAAKVLATSEGNPLFVGELVRMLVDEGAIERDGERWIVGANLAALEMPPTIHALLAARIERLGPEDRAVLERAAVVGRHFSRSAVSALLGRNGSELNARLEALQRTELIERDTGWFLGEPVLRFHHVLIRDAAYRRLLKGTRAALHAQLADWIEAQVGDAPEHDETIGWHLEQAHQHRRELGPLDASGRAIGERAARRLGAAGRRALARDDAPVAAGLLGRALERLAEGDPARAELVLDWCEALLASGDVTTAENAIAELGRSVGDPSLASDPRRAAWHTCFAGQLTVLTAPQALHDTARAVAAAAAELASLGDAAGEAKGHFVHALALARLGRIGGCEAALDKALAAARRADDRRRANTVLAIAPLAALWGPSPVTRASGRCLDVVRVLRITQGAPAVEAVALSCQAVLEALRGRADAARRMIAAARKMVEDLGITQRLLEADVFAGLIDLLEGDAAAAERSLRGAYHGLRDLGLGIDAARAAALLARALLAQDRAQEAEALSHESEALAGDDLKAAIAWRGVRAEALARRGEHAAAVELAQAAVGIAAATDALLDHADARLALAAALRAVGRGRDADAEERRAIELWDAKGAVLLVQRTRRPEVRGAATAAATASAQEPRAAPAPRRRVTPNTATAALLAINAAMAAPDLAVFRELMSESYEEIDHPTGVTYGRDENVAALERLMRSRDASCRHEPLATLGDVLVLSRRRVHASSTGGGRFDVGEYEQEAYGILEVDERGRFRRHEVFAADHLHDARVRLFARHAELLPDGPERTRAAAAAQSLDVFRRAETDPDILRRTETDPDILVAALAPDFEGVDHRHLSSHSLHGAAAYIEHLRGWRQVAHDPVFVAGSHPLPGLPRLAATQFRECDILALEPHAMLVATLHTGIARSGGGAYERPFLTLFVVDTRGRLARAEWFDADREADALARFDELVASAAPQRAVRRRVPPNGATGTVERFGAAVAAHDLDALGHVLCEEVQAVHHQTGVTYGRKGFLATWRSMFRADRMIRQQATIASLGDSLALGHHTIRLEGFSEAHLAAVGAVEIDEVVLFEVDERGRARRFDLFPVEKLGDAAALLYERHAALLPDGPERTRAAATAQSLDVFRRAVPDPERIALALAPDFESVDHRHLSSWSLCGADAYLAHLRALREVADDVEFRELDLLACSALAQLVRVLHTGTDRAGGGTYERPFLRLFVAGADGRISRAEWFDDDREAEALARFDELARSPDAPDRFANAATATVRPVIAHMAAHDWPGFTQLFAGSFRISDRRRVVQLEMDRVQYVAFTREIADGRAIRARSEIVATRGERLALTRSTFEFKGDDVGPSEVAFLLLTQVDESGRIDAYVRWDPEDIDAAWAELDARYEAGEGAVHPPFASVFSDALARRDWDAIAALCGPGFVEHDHRSIAVLGPSASPGVWANNFRALVDLAPDTVARFEHVRPCPRGAFWTLRWEGSRDGGRYEIPIVGVGESDEHGKIARNDLYDPEQLDQALARFAAIGAARTDAVAPIALPAAVVATMERLLGSFDAQDWDTVRAACSSRFRWEDRRPIVGISGDLELMIASARERLASGARHERREIIGLAGERVIVTRILWAGGPADGRFEVEFLAVHELDADGLCTASIFFDPGDPRTAQREAWARWVAIDPTAAEQTAALGETIDAWNAKDPERLRATFAEDLVVEDHRWTGTGRSEGREAYLRTVMALWELAPDSRFEAGWLWLARAPHGSVYTCRRSGTLPGGGEFVSDFLVVTVLERGLATRVEVFEADATDAALARFAELHPDPLRIPLEIGA